jgi:hypothetical protein
MAEEVEREAISRGLPQVEALACGDLAAAYSELGMPLRALQADYRSFQLASDPAHRVRTLGNIATDLVQLGAFEPARIAFELVSRSNSKAVVRLNAIVELIALGAATGDQAAFERNRRAALRLRHRMPPSMEVDFLFKSASGFSRFGQTARARAALTEARAVAENHALHAWEFRIDHAFKDLGAGTTPPVSKAAATPLSDSPVVREVAVSLREYAAALT